MKWNPWPYAIIAYFAVFITGVATWITFAVRHDQQLVSPDYYDREIKFQQQIDRVARTASFRTDVFIAYHPEAKTIAIVLPSHASSEKSQGEVQFYRPSDANLDQRFTLALDGHNSQIINVAAFKSGYWKVRLVWSTGGADYYFDQSVILEGN